MHQALYRKWRPQTFDDVYGQDHITSVLKYETANTKLSHAYLFCGSRGTGKTTCAKILAKAVNCEAPENGNPCNKCASCRSIDAGSATDVLEMDAASNNGVDNIRDIRDEVVYTPSSLRFRVYIVDEVHMLTGSAFNALLKTLEEPPSHVVFILATTELHKLPATIISRCQRFDFRRITVSDIMARLAYIAQNEGLKAENDALRLIAKYAQGGMRDAISLFELCAGNRASLTAQAVIDTIGTSGYETIAKLLVAINEGDYDTIFSVVDNVVRSSKDISVFWNDMISYCRNILVYKTVSDPKVYLDLTDTESKQLDEVAKLFTKDTVLYFIRLLNDSLYLMQKAGANKRNIAEMTLVRMGDESLNYSNEAILSRLSKLEAKLSGATISFANTIKSEQTSEKTTKKEIQTEVALDKNSAKTQKSAPAPSANQQSEKIIRGWQEIAQKVTVDDPSTTPFLKMSRGYVTPDGKVTVKFKNSFAKDMFLKSGLSSLLCVYIGLALKCSIDEGNVEFVVSQEVSDDNDGFEDIIQ